jgi:short-subunit dehydrogenase
MLLLLSFCAIPQQYRPCLPMQALQGQNIKVTLFCPALVSTDMAAQQGRETEGIIEPGDIAEAALLPFRLSSTAVPQCIVVQNSCAVN